jgi:protein SCO1/2
MKYLVPLFAVFALVFSSCSKQPGRQQPTSGQQPVCCMKPEAMNATAAPAGGNSIYQVASTWTDEDKEPFRLAALEGKTQVVAMIFTHCGYACPRIVDNMKAVEAALPEARRAGTGFVLVSFDPARDSAGALKAYADEKGLDGRWTLLHGTEGQVRELSMLLNVHYNALPGGNFNHSNVITVLDKKGAIVKEFQGLDINVKDVVGAIASVD